eukprot:4583263-Prymnesium_polylepis.1
MASLCQRLRDAAPPRAGKDGRSSCWHVVSDSSTDRTLRAPASALRRRPGPSTDVHRRGQGGRDLMRKSVVLAHSRLALPRSAAC